MAKTRNTQEAMAKDAAKRLDEARAIGQQLSFLPGEPGSTPEEVAGAKPIGRPKGATGKGSSQLRKFLAAKGYRMPEDQLAEMAGLSSSDDAMLTAMTNAERVLAWAFDGAKDKDGNARSPAPEQRVAMFAQLYATMLRAADALMPYGSAKAAPDVAVQQTVQLVLQNGPTGGADPAQARDVTPLDGSELMPADVKWEIEQNQRISTPQDENSDSPIRTQGGSD